MKEIYPNENKIIINAIDLLNANDNDDITNIAYFAIFNSLSHSHRESLLQLVKHGPCWDGDVISKRHRNDLIAIGLAARVIVKGEDGFTAATYRGARVHKHAPSPKLEVKDEQ